MSDTKPAGASGLTRAEIAEHLAARAAEAKPSTGAALVARWDRADRSLAYQLDRDAMAADMDAAIKQARREGAEAMREASARVCDEERLPRHRASTDLDRAFNEGIGNCADIIRALPLPGDAS